MISLRFDQLAQITGGQLNGSNSDSCNFRGVSIDSRTVQGGELFVAVKGERFDGHSYVKEALNRGANGLLVEKGKVEVGYLSGDDIYVEVTNSHQAMIKLAKAYLDSCDAKRIGITGSNGKTTTKEITSQLLSAITTDIYHSPGNYNNLFGIPLAIFGMPQKTKIAVLEMGISTPGEMAQLSELVRPDIVAVTNVSPTHLQFLGSVEAVVREKLSLTNSMPNKAPLIVNADDKLLASEARKVSSNIITFGVDKKADFYPESVTTKNDQTEIKIEGINFELDLFGDYQVYNLLAAYAIVRSLGYSFEGFTSKTIKLTSAPMRGQKVKIGDVTFIDDCYNANPESVKQGLKSFAAIKTDKRKIIVIGSMLELGVESENFHAELGHEFDNELFDQIFLVGEETEQTLRAAVDNGVSSTNIHYYRDSESCAVAMPNFLQAGDLIYLKGSRSVGLEKIISIYRDKVGKS